ncbi:MAG: hypothetical protein FWF88_13040 [Peptococcaceae bacterium]|jgi:hypothetical protein|nr:hypothetical protein [Peptococcaceae bacterium]
MSQYPKCYNGQTRRVLLNDNYQSADILSTVIVQGEAPGMYSRTRSTPAHTNRRFSEKSYGSEKIPEIPEIPERFLISYLFPINAFKNI